jgi:NADPH:quinone reductase-like Zn-dependent oxidoreductase
MKAMQFTPWGGLTSLRQKETAQPEPGPSQILVEVEATAVNPIDWKLRSGAVRWIASAAGLAATPCFDFAGTVRALGTAVEGFQVGDRVFGMRPLRGMGTAAEYLAVEASCASPLPKALSAAEAAGLPLAGLTALQALRYQGGLRAGQQALIIGAAGGVGHYAVQIAKALGAEVTGVCSAGNVEGVRSLGADQVIDYTGDDLNARRGPFDVILDAAVHLPFRQWRPWLAERGVYISLLPKPGLVLQGWALALHTRQRMRFTGAKPNRADLDTLACLAEAGKLRTWIDSTYPLEQLGAALERSRGGRARGKIIVRIDT